MTKGEIPVGQRDLWDSNGNQLWHWCDRCEHAWMHGHHGGHDCLDVLKRSGRTLSPDSPTTPIGGPSLRDQFALAIAPHYVGAITRACMEGEVEMEKESVGRNLWVYVDLILAARDAAKGTDNATG